MNDLLPSFTIDEARRELRCNGTSIELEPRIFDVVVYLAAHSDRVVSKDELLDAVWPDLDVGDGSLQRAISVARKALRDAGMGDAIRTFARRGYRFCLDSDDGPSVTATAQVSGASASAARAAYDSGDWHLASNHFALADREGSLAAEELEAFGHALLRSGCLRQAPAILERAVAGYVLRGDHKAGARTAVALGLAHWQCEDLALARGWQRRAAALVAGMEECRETGLVQWLDAFILVLECDFEEGTRRAQAVYELGLRLGDADLHALGCAFSALGSLAMGTPEAAPLLDEAAATAVSGGVSAWAGAHILCGTLWGYRNVGDWDRAAQWAQQYVRWCERTGMGNSPGTWRLHRLEVLAQRADLDAALEESIELPAMLSNLAPWAVGDAWRVIGEMLVVQHDFSLAQAAFEEAGRYGWDPQPGLALLHLGRGRPEAAIRSLERAIAVPGFLNAQRRPVLEGYLVLALAAGGQDARAATLLDEIVSRPGALTTRALQALVARGRAEIAALGGRMREAITEAGIAAQCWSEAGSPVLEARSRLRLAQLMLADGDFDGADVEAGIACRQASGLRAHFIVEGCNDLRARIEARDARLLPMPELGPSEEPSLRTAPRAPEQLRERLASRALELAGA